MCLPPGSLRLLLSLCFLGLCLYPFLETVKAYAEKLGVPSVCAYIDAMDKNNNTIELTELQRALILIDGADSATLKCLNIGINTRRTLLSERAVASLVVGQLTFWLRCLPKKESPMRSITWVILLPPRGPRTTTPVWSLTVIPCIKLMETSRYVM